jgi:von Hippel-Lindau disease tumor supressor
MVEDSEVAGYILRSEHSLHQSFVRFINNSNRTVDVIWINFEGRHVKYKSLQPGVFFDVNTYATHPWVFLDSETQDRLVVRSKEVFLPEQCHVQLVHLRREAFPPMPQRTHVYITIPLYTLRERSLQVVRNSLSQPEDAFKLEVPNTLQRELAAMVQKTVQFQSSASHSVL